MSSVGCSLKATPAKWDRLQILMPAQIAICKAIQSGRNGGWLDPGYELFDFYAGPGIYTEEDSPGLCGNHGSPMIAIKAIASHYQENQWNAFFSDEDEDTCRRLRQAVGQVSNITIANKTCEEAIDGLIADKKRIKSRRKPIPGLAFFDPNGMPCWDHVKAFVSAFRHIDILINLNSTVHKRVANSPVHSDTMLSSERLRWLDKKHVSLWEPARGDQHGFTLALCSDGVAMKGMSKAGFHHIDSDKGKMVVERIDCTPKQRNARHPFLPGF